jgi:hypothetical protein
VSDRCRPDGGDGDGDGRARGLLARVRHRLADRAAGATDPRVTLGERVLAVEVTLAESGRRMGLAHRPAGDPAAALGPTGGATVRRLTAATDAPAPIDRAVGVATLNALSVPDVDWRAGDPMADLPDDATVIATVGLFRPAFRKFSDVTVRVVERDPPTAATVETPPGVAVETFAPGDCERAFAGADVCFLTGSTLLYGGIDRYLTALSAAGVAPVVLVGATASHLPAPAFEAGVDVVAGARVGRGERDRDRVRDRIRAGDCGTDLHDAGVQKVYATPSGDRDGGTAAAVEGAHGDGSELPAGADPGGRTVTHGSGPGPGPGPGSGHGHEDGATDAAGDGAGEPDGATDTDTDTDTEVTDA